MLQFGIDCSNWSGIPSQASLDKLVQGGYNWAIPGTQRFANGVGYTGQQIEAFERVGIRVPSVYVYLYFDGNDIARINHAKQFGKFIWLDVEEQNATEAGVQMAVDVVGESLAGIYTGAWIPIWRTTSAFKNIPLWHAEYPNTIPTEFEKFFNGGFVPYGGWKVPSIWQFKGTTHIEGFGVDLNVYYEPDVIVPEPQPIPPPNIHEVVVTMTDGRVRRFQEVV